MFAVADWLDRWLVSAQVLLASWWATWVLFSPPSNFAAFPNSFWFIGSHLLLDERQWATVIGCGALAHTIGFLFRSWGWLSAARGLSFAGLAVETIFWLVFGLSTIYANLDTLFGFTGTLVGITAAWRLFRIGLVMPDGR